VEGAEVYVLSDNALSITRRIIIEVWSPNLSKILRKTKFSWF